MPAQYRTIIFRMEIVNGSQVRQTNVYLACFNKAVSASEEQNFFCELALMWELLLHMHVPYVTVPEKTDHSAPISDVEILVPRCSALFTLRNGEVRIAIGIYHSRVTRVQVRASKKSFLAENCER